MFELGLKRFEQELKNKGKSRLDSQSRSTEFTSKGGNPDFPLKSAESWKRNCKNVPASRSPLHSVTLIPYGGNIRYRGGIIELNNTCNIDNQLQIIYTLYTLHPVVGDYLGRLTADSLAAGLLLRIFSAIDKKQWSIAREITLFQLMKLQPQVNSDQEWSLFDSEERFLTSIEELTKVKQHHQCTNKACIIPREALISTVQGLVVTSPQCFEEKFNTKQTLAKCEGCNKGRSTTWLSWPPSGPPLLLPYALQPGRTRQQRRILFQAHRQFWDRSIMLKLTRFKKLIILLLHF